MKYKSELLSELIEKNGHATTKVPHYESECENEFISEVRGAYPKLIDYSGEWLNYANNHVNIGKFPTERVVNVTNARFENVVPYGYKSAILRGQTLVNLFQDMDYVWNNLTKQDSFNYNGDLIILNNGYYDGRYWNSVPKIPNIKSNTEYTMIFTKGSSPYVEFGTIDENGNDSVLKRYTNAQKVKITSPNNGDVRVKFCIENPTSDKSAINLGKVMFIEGDYTNVDIPYFEGMQSVKLPVLTTTGKNLANQLLPLDSSGANVTSTKIENSSKALSSLIKIHPNQRIVISKNNAGSRFRCFFFDRYPVVSKTTSIGGLYADIGTTIKVTSPVNSEYLLVVWCNDKNTECPINYQVEYGSEKTDWEPFKSNILTVNEDVTLRSNGNVYDELDLLTGKLTQRIDEDGSVLTQEVDKTVDLSCLDENNNPTKFKPYEGVMNVVTSSETLPPLLDMEVPVEAITQNLMSFIK